MHVTIKTIPLLLLIAACSSNEGEVKRQAYLDADYYTRLELPPDLTEPANSKELLIPEPAESAKQRFESDTANLGASEASAQAPPAAPPVAMPSRVLAGAALQADGDRQWLELGQPVEQVWSVIESFLLQEGMPVKRREPLIGLLETDWVSKFQVPEDAGYLARAFSNLEPDRIDRFTVRIESAADGAASRVFITHAGMEQYVEEDDINWRSREREPALEAEMMQRLALYVGASTSGVELDGYRPFAQRTRESAHHPNSFEIAGDRQFVLPRIESVLAGMNITGIEHGEAGELIILLDAQVEPVSDVEQDDIAESSVIMQFFTDKDGESSRRLLLRLTELENYTRIDIESPQGGLDDSVTAEQFGSRLREQLI